MKTHLIEGAPAAIGPYSHAVSVGDLVLCSGQTPIDPATGEVIGKTIEEQTDRVFDNLQIVLRGVGLELENIVKTNVYLADMTLFEGMNQTYANRLGDHRPARTTVAVRENPLQALVEIECIAERAS